MDLSWPVYFGAITGTVGMVTGIRGMIVAGDQRQREQTTATWNRERMRCWAAGYAGDPVRPFAVRLLALTASAAVCACASTPPTKIGADTYYSSNIRRRDCRGGKIDGGR